MQSEFATERQLLFEYLTRDALLGRFFEPFIFENHPAADHRVDTIYLEEVANSDIYLGIFGTGYGYEDKEGISPTEREYDHATHLRKTRLVFLSHHSKTERHPKEIALIQKAESAVIRRQFSSPDDLKLVVYAALVRYLEEKEFLRTGPFDASVCKGAVIEDIDNEQVADFVRLARAKRGFPLTPEAPPEKILTHLNLLRGNDLTNAAILLFGRKPQKSFISSEVKCAQFHGNEVRKPIRSYQVYKGDLFQLVNQAVDFVLSRIDLAVGTRNESVDVPIEYEIPMAAVTEAIVNAIAHRDYTSTGSVEVMLFRNRLEVRNPGQLPHTLTLERLKQPHSSQPFNPLIAEPLYLAGFIERLGTGIPDMIDLCRNAGLKEPEFSQEDTFKTILWRMDSSDGDNTRQAAGDVAGQATGQVDIGTTRQAGEEVTRQADEETSRQGSEEDTRQATRQGDEEVTRQADEETSRQGSEKGTRQANEEVAETIRRVVLVLVGEMKRVKIQELLRLKDRENFVLNYMTPALNSEYIEMTIPDTPTHQEQRYRLTTKGIGLKKKLQKSKKK